MSHWWEIVESDTKVTMELMEQHLIQTTKVHIMIQAFMATLEKYMKTLTNNTSLHEDSLEEIPYCIFISLYD